MKAMIGYGVIPIRMTSILNSCWCRLYRCVCVTFLSIGCTVVLMWFFALNSDLRAMVLGKLKSKMHIASNSK